MQCLCEINNKLARNVSKKKSKACGSIYLSILISTLGCRIVLRPLLGKKNTSQKGASVKVVASVLWKKKKKKPNPSCLLTRLCWICWALHQCDKCSIRGDSTVVVLHRHEDVAVVAPVGGPWVLNQPVRLSIQDAVSHGEHSVVQVIRGVTCQSQPRG